jgi:Orange carotenoid protein, N-terminal
LIGTSWRILMTITTSNLNPQLISSFETLSTDQKLALLWYIYKEVGKSITSAAPGASTASPAVAEGIFQQVLEMSHEEQLQLQRDLVERKDGSVCREYGALSDTTKLLFWYLLAQGMERSEVIPMPENYSLEPQASQCLTELQAHEYSEQITILRELIAPMGVDSDSLSPGEIG